MYRTYLGKIKHFDESKQEDENEQGRFAMTMHVLKTP
jgi:hypothetical protein